ncbi:uncharacterized protein LOC129597334 [Paramacrobiotus metropolitanus]|uniref:uncharacterized protein LOC129597334 n=1 Tax=Paramacrobiotus metropolitanus TaxID=2943436 RepID=UPI002446356C|nr:uncharacterized protein LOC129597334 [Paramacrobiotus metropolitanus]
MDMYIAHCLSVKATRLPVIVLKNIRCLRVIDYDKHYEMQRLEWCTLGFVMQVCQVLHLRDVTFPTVFGPIAGLWRAPAGIGQDVNVLVEKAVLDCSLSKIDRLRHFTRILDAGYPALSASEWDVIDQACRAMITDAEQPLRCRLFLMLKLLNEPVTGQLQPPLCSLAAHAYRYSYEPYPTVKPSISASATLPVERPVTPAISTASGLHTGIKNGCRIQ